MGLAGQALLEVTLGAGGMYLWGAPVGAEIVDGNGDLIWRIGMFAPNNSAVKFFIWRGADGVVRRPAGATFWYREPSGLMRVESDNLRWYSASGAAMVEPPQLEPPMVEDTRDYLAAITGGKSIIDGPEPATPGPAKPH